MSLNKYMHPRNIYKTPPNFKQLAIDFPEFRSYVQQDVTGKISIDFKDVKALRALTCTLLKKDFQLDVNVPETKMIPTIPLRLNYILWIEDLLSISGDAIDVRGIDIGTGASCIYPLIAAKKNGWTMLATDVDDESFNCARENVAKNSLNHLITVKKVNEGSLLVDAIGSENYNFCMCNPPFFSSVHELNPVFKARKPDRPRSRNAFCAAPTEVITDGGEVRFVTKIIEESKRLDKRIKIYTSMVGHKSSLPQLKKLLREADVMSFKQTEFFQGRTTRWALAWTYHDIDLRAVPEATLVAARKQKTKPPLQYLIPADKIDQNQLVAKLKQILYDLEIVYEQKTKESKHMFGLAITAQSDTWSHQRRKRREKEHKSSFHDDKETATERSPPVAETSTTSNGGSPNVQEASDMISQMNVRSPKNPSKRELEEDGFYNSKRIKLDSTASHYLKGSLVVRKIDSNLAVELSYIDGAAGKEGLHQILQYIKNNLKLQ